MHFARLLLCLVMLFLASGCGPLAPRSCASQAADYVLQLDPLVARWEMVVAEADTKAGSAVPADLAVTLEDLARLTDAVALLDPPQCAELVQLAASKLLLQSVRLYQAMADGADQAAVAAERQRLDERYQQYVAERKGLGAE